MNLRSFTVKNFKGIGEKEVTIHFSPITLLFGPNNSGKSTILEALNLAKEIFCNKNIENDLSYCMDLFRFKNLVNQHDISKSISFKFTFNSENAYDYDDIIYMKDDNITAGTFGSYLVMVQVNERHQPSLLDAYTKLIIEKTLNDVRRVSYDISISYDPTYKLAYISKRSTYIDDILVASIHTKLTECAYSQSIQEKNIFNGLDNDIFFKNYKPINLVKEFYNLYDSRLSNVLKYKKYKPLHFDSKYYFDKIYLHGYDYEIFEQRIGFITQKNSIKIYNLVLNLIRLKLLYLKDQSSEIIESINNIDLKIKNIFAYEYNKILKRKLNFENDFIFETSNIEPKFMFTSPKDIDIKFKRALFPSFLKNNKYELDESLLSYNNKEIQVSYKDNFYSLGLNDILGVNFISNGGHNSFITLFLKSIIFSPIRMISDTLYDMVHVNNRRLEINKDDNRLLDQDLKQELIDKINIDLDTFFGDDFDLRLCTFKDISIDLEKFTILINKIKFDTDKKISLKEVTDAVIESSINIKNRIMFKDKNGKNFNISDLGYGISQFIPIMIKLLKDEEKDYIIIIEEPESHIHPAWQVKLAEFFLKIKNNRKEFFENYSPHTILLETHSEHIMLRILRRIRETNENELPEGAQSAYPDDISVYYIQKDELGNTNAKLMKITPDGDFQEKWPKGFFEERIEELFS